MGSCEFRRDQGCDIPGRGSSQGHDPRILQQSPRPLHPAAQSVHDDVEWRKTSFEMQGAMMTAKTDAFQKRGRLRCVRHRKPAAQTRRVAAAPGYGGLDQDAPDPAPAVGRNHVQHAREAAGFRLRLGRVTPRQRTRSNQRVLRGYGAAPDGDNQLRRAARGECHRQEHTARPHIGIDRMTDLDIGKHLHTLSVAQVAPSMIVFWP